MRTTIWNGQAAWILESAEACVVVVPGMGAKIVSLLDKRSGFEWLAAPMPGRRVGPVTYPAAFVQADMAGWDEMFPTINACAYPGAGPLHGVPLPDHGEVWQLPWVPAPGRDGELALAVTGRALPYRLTRRATLAADTLTMRYTLENLGGHPMPYLWAAHPQFLAGDDGGDCQVIFPAELTEVVNTVGDSADWGAAETVHPWPEATAADGSHVRLDQVGPTTLRKGLKFFAPPDKRPTWAAVLRKTSGQWVRLEWNAKEVPYLGLWIDEGLVNSAAVAAPEPGTGWYDSLAIAWQKGEVTIVPAGGTREWSLTVRLGNNGSPIP